MDFIDSIGNDLSNKLGLKDNIDNDKIIIALYDDASILYLDASSPHLTMSGILSIKERITRISSRLIEIDEWVETIKIFLETNKLKYGDNYINGQYYKFTVYSIISLFVCNYGKYSDIVIEVFFKNIMLSFIDDYLHIHKYPDLYIMVENLLKRA